MIALATELHSSLGSCRPGVKRYTNGFDRLSIRDFNNTGLQTVQVGVSLFAGNLLKSIPHTPSGSPISCYPGSLPAICWI